MDVKIEDLQNEIIKLKEQVKEMDNLKKELQNKEERITSLQEHNQKLFLKVTGESKNENGNYSNSPLSPFEKSLGSDLSNILNELIEEE